ncbi:hypothetical protein H6P81_014972 [Aristolochia fimbriata]|uniref:Purple acid phosphatase n=1 Tax=Aristolochia fimbriata TaxID=158543 RepID=A0AAV7E460_ARIFI|nr:hypothetical protein H6P81_014972 [Aristolochia fimbriata]
MGASVFLSIFSKNAPLRPRFPNTQKMQSLPLQYLWLFIVLICFFLPSRCNCLSSTPPATILNHSTEDQFRDFTAISDFRLLNRRRLLQCPEPNPYVNITTSTSVPLKDEEYVTVNVTGVVVPSESDWVAMISPSNSDVSNCPLNRLLYDQTGDLSDLPLLCHYPVKAQFLNTDPAYLGCERKECKKHENGTTVCAVTTCSGSIKFHVINIRTEIEFVFFTGGFKNPCILKRSEAVNFENPNNPLYGHLSSVDSSATSMRITWVSGDKAPQQVQYAEGKSVTSEVATFTQDDMCSSPLKSPAKDFGWHDPGYVHSAVMTGLRPSTTYSYRYGSDSVGWSDEIKFKTPPAGGSEAELRFLAFGDMGKAPRDPSLEHFIQPGSISVVEAMMEEVDNGNVDAIFHIGDISYATGFLVEWDYFLHLIAPLASRVSYMTAIGNHERDYIGSGSVYITPDSGGECGVAYETYFPMPTSGKDKPWYSVEQAGVHFTVISTEHDWTEGSDQYEWMKKDLGSVDRAQTPWLIFTGHRPMYTSQERGLLPPVDNGFVRAVEPLLMNYKVDVVLFGHVHNYERTCAVYQKECISFPTKDKDGIDTYNNSNYTAPVHVIIGMAGFTLDNFTESVSNWSLVRIADFGYTRVHATRNQIQMEYSSSGGGKVEEKTMWFLRPVFRFSLVFFLLSGFFSRCFCDYGVGSGAQFDGSTGISDFRILNRRSLMQCPNADPYLQLNVSVSSALADEEYLTVTASGIQNPSELEWIAMISGAYSNVSSCPENQILYQETGDLSNLPFLCHYPIKAQNLSADPDYLSCEKKECKVHKGGVCAVMTCSSSLKFHVINVRTDIEFVLFGAGYHSPCVLKRSAAIPFSNAKMPLYGHLSSIDSTGTSMKLTWVSGGGSPQLVRYANGKSAISQVTTFTQNDMCRSILRSPANDFGWHDPGFVHSAVMTGLKPSTIYYYKYGSDSVGWSDQIKFKTPPASGAGDLQFLAYGDMGKAPRDLSVEHFIQPGSISVAKALTEEVAEGKVDSIFHIGDISYATGFLVEWDYFLHLITPIASRVPYMTAIGNHERDFMNSGSVYGTPDSGGECGVVYETYFPMPTPGKDKPWYSMEQGSVHFTVISTEHDWKEGTEQYEWIKKDLQSVNREKTPWIIFMGHRPMYSSSISMFLPSVDEKFVTAVEPLLMDFKVDLVLVGHVHAYERSCAVYGKECKSMPRRDENGIDTYYSRNYSAPVHVTIGMAGFSLDGFNVLGEKWSLAKFSEFGYTRIRVTKEEIKLEFINSQTKKTEPPASPAHPVTSASPPMLAATKFIIITIAILLLSVFW